MGISYSIDGDAFSSGQISSKLWLCRALERLYTREVGHGYGPDGGLLMPRQVVWLFGGWYAVTNLLLQTRGKIRLDHVRSFDIDPQATVNATMINENWLWRHGEFEAYTADCNAIAYDDLTPYHTRLPDLIINTSTEHFDTLKWFEAIPAGTRVALQSNDMIHDDHCIRITSQAAMAKTFPLSRIEVADELRFDYPDWSFTRYMLIGRK